MVATLCLFSCVLAAAQTPDRPVTPVPPRPGPGIPNVVPAPKAPPVNDVPLALKLERAQELVYRGAFTETDIASGVQAERSYRVESRLFVLDTNAKHAETAVLTILKPRSASGQGPSQGISSVRLEILRVDPHGIIEADPGVSLTTPLDGPPTLECNAIIPMPVHRVGEGQAWQTFEEKRPARNWEVAGSEAVNGHGCMKLIGTQQTADWEQPRGDRSAWRRVDTVWLSPRTGYAYRVERVIERRGAGRTQTTQKSIMRYELETSLTYPQKLYEDRRHEVQQARAFSAEALPMLSKPGQYGPQLETLLGKIKQHIESSPPTPYREALVQVQKQVEAAQRGETPPVVRVNHEEQEAPPAVATLGAQAPEFTAPAIHDGKPRHLKQFNGKPIMLVFYQSTSVTADELLRFAQGIQEAGKDAVTVLGMAYHTDNKIAAKQIEGLKLTFPLLDGSGLRQSYAVEATPKIVVIDALGVVRGSWTGWGHETPIAVANELRKCLAQPNTPK